MVPSMSCAANWEGQCPKVLKKGKMSQIGAFVMDGGRVWLGVAWRASGVDVKFCRGTPALQPPRPTGVAAENNSTEYNDIRSHSNFPAIC